MEIDRAAFLARVPDEPRFVAARALLEAPYGGVLGAPDGSFVVFDRFFPFGCAVGPPDVDLARAFADESPGGELLVQAEDLSAARAALAGWDEHPATCFVHPDPASLPAPDADTRVLEPGEPLARHPAMPASLADEVELAIARGAPVAAAFEGGAMVSFCYAFLSSAAHWDVSVDTLEHARRRGSGRASFLALARHLLAGGRRPVWGTLDANTASRALARKLGFEPRATFGVLEAPDES